MSAKRRKPKSKPIASRHRSWGESELQRCQRDYLYGNRLALAHAIAICAKLVIPLPAWAAAAYVAGYRDLINYHADNWESIFGPAKPEGHLNALRKRHQKSVAVGLAIEREHEAGKPIDDELFTAIGTKLGIGATLVKEYYKEHKVVMERIRKRLEEDEREYTAWIIRHAEAAHSAVDAGDIERAQALIAAMKERYSKYFGMNAPPA